MNGTMGIAFGSFSYLRHLLHLAVGQCLRWGTCMVSKTLGEKNTAEGQMQVTVFFPS